MSKLYVFGCSFSGLHSMDLLSNTDMKKYYEFRNGNLPPTWSEILANNINLELVNMARWGSDNYEIFENFCKKINEIKKDDVVIIGWTQISRCRLFSEYYNKLFTINIWETNENKHFSNISQKTIEELMVNRSNKIWADEVYNWMDIINKLSDLIKFKLHYWSFFSEFKEICIINDLLKLGAEYITNETNRKVYNDHFGQKGHEVQAEYFKKLILNKKN